MAIQKIGRCVFEVNVRMLFRNIRLLLSVIYVSQGIIDQPNSSSSNTTNWTDLEEIIEDTLVNKGSANMFNIGPIIMQIFKDIKQQNDKMMTRY